MAPQKPNVIPLNFPKQGLHETMEAGAQPPGTTHDAQNMRARDPKTGRYRGAQRSGMTNFIASGGGGTDNTKLHDDDNAVKDINVVTYDQKNVIYDSLASGSVATEETTTPTDSVSDQRVIATDRQSNVYTIDGGNRLVKFNSDLAEIAAVTVPTENESNEIRSMVVDTVDNVFLGVTTGGPQSSARVFRYIPDTDDELKLTWTLIPRNRDGHSGFVTDIRVSGGLLYMAINRPDRNQSDVVVYSNIRSGAEPDFDWSREVPYPTTGLAIKSDGSILVTSEEFTDRGVDPNSSGTTQTVIAWDPVKDLTDYDTRVWCHLDASTITSDDTLDGTLVEGSEILTWVDKSGKGRNLFAHTSHKPPTFNPAGIAGRPSVHFDGVNDAMESSFNPGTSQESRSSQRTILPSYLGNQWCMFIVLKTPADSTKRWVMGQRRTTGASYNTTTDFLLWANRQSGSSSPGTTEEGAMSWFALGNTVTAPPNGNNNHPNAAYWVSNPGEAVPNTATDPSNTANASDAMILTILEDGGLINGEGDENTTRSLFRMNGFPIDRWKGRSNATGDVADNPTEVGRWGFPTSGTSFFAGEIAEIFVLDRKDVDDDTAGVLTHEGFGTGQSYDKAEADQGTNEMTRIEGYLMWKYGISHLAPTPSSADDYGHPYEISQGPATSDDNTDAAVYANTGQTLLKLSSTQGQLVWAIPDDNSTFVSGIGYGCAVNSSGNIYSIGDPEGHADNTKDTHIVRLITDEGEGRTYTGGSTWQQTVTDLFGSSATVSFTNKYARLVVDAFDNLFTSMIDNGQSTSGANRMFVFEPDGDTLLNFTFTDSGRNIGIWSAALPASNPDYDTSEDFTSVPGIGTERPEFVFLGLDNQTVGDGQGSSTFNDTLKKIRLVSRVVQDRAPRLTQLVGVSAGFIKTFSASGSASPSGGSPNLTSLSTYVESTVLKEEVFFTDGQNVLVYNAKADTVSQLDSETAGSHPMRQRLITNWRNRLVLGRGHDSPQNWHMSAVDNPRDWNQFPAVATTTQAVSGNNARAGRLPDIVNTMIPYSDDLLVFGGDQSVWQLTGDPAAGGQMDLVSDITGMSFGRPWTKDPTGVLYFFGSKGGVYRWVPGTPLTEDARLSRGRIEDRLRNINLSTFHVKLLWNHRDEGLHVFVIPFTTSRTGSSQTLTIRDHYFWEQETDSWWVDDFNNADLQPTAAAIVDGDSEDDRILLVGTDSGRVQEWDKDATNDDATAIDAFTFLGPLQGKDEFSEWRFARPQCELASTQNGCAIDLYTSEDGDAPGSSVASGSFSAGRNSRLGIRTRGARCWVRLRNNTSSERFAYESGSIQAYRTGRVRVR